MDFRLCRTRGEGRRLLYSVGFNVVLAAEHHVLIRISQRPPQKSDERHVLISYQGDFLIRFFRDYTYYTTKTPLTVVISRFHTSNR